MNKPLAAAVLALCSLAAHAEPPVRVDDPWIRPTVPAQTTTAAYMSLTATQSAKLVSATSPVAASVSVHEMSMEGDVMRMRAVSGLPLPAGQKVELKPGGYHLMLTGLKHQVALGDVVPFTLTVQGDDGKQQTVEVRAAARAAK
jgi:copper(I)-binding protein